MSPSAFFGRFDSLMAVILLVSRNVVGKLARYVSQMVLSYSLANAMSNPARSNHKSRPPAPEKSEMTFMNA